MKFKIYLYYYKVLNLWMELSIVIPAYNEEKRIGETFSKITDFLNKNRIQNEIILVDDGSTDKTIDIVKKFKGDIRILRNRINSGKGYSVRRGIENAKYNLVIFTDADLSTPIEELSLMFKEIKNGNDIVIASRSLPESVIVVKQPFYRQILGRAFPFFVRLLLIPRLKDTQCGFKLFKTNVAKRLVKFQTVCRFSFDVELLYLAKRLGYRIKEVPVTWVDKKGSKGNPFKDAFIMFGDLIRIRFNAFVGKYR